MSVVDLHGELAAAIDAVTPRHVARFNELGLDVAARARVGLVGVARIAERHGGIYDLSEAGVPALIFPVWDGPICDPEVAFCYPSPLIDLAAWRPGEPEAPVLTRCGIATLLGNAAVEGARMFHEPLRIFRAPIAWACAGGDGVGIVVLDWSADIGLLHIETVVAEDIEHGEEIRRHLQKLRRKLTPSLPVIAVPSPQHAEAIA